MNSNQLDIGRNIRAIRTRMNMTQQVLANQCGLSKGMISKVENGVVVPALATLTKIAQALNVKVTELIETENQQPSVWTINPFSDPDKFIVTSMGYTIFNPAAGLTDKMMQPIMVSATQSKIKPHLLSHPGEEYIFVFDGEMTFKVGDTTYLMRRGDSLFFDALQKHGISTVHKFVQYLDMFVGHHYNADGETPI